MSCSWAGLSYLLHLRVRFPVSLRNVVSFGSSSFSVPVSRAPFIRPDVSLFRARKTYQQGKVDGQKIMPRSGRFALFVGSQEGGVQTSGSFFSTRSVRRSFSSASISTFDAFLCFLDGRDLT